MGVVVGGIAGVLTGALVGAVGFALADAGFGRGMGIFGPSLLVGGLVGAMMVGVAGCAAGALSGGIGGTRKWSVVAGGGIGLLAATYVFSMNAANFLAFGAVASVAILLGCVGAGLAGGDLSRRWIYRDH